MILEKYEGELENIKDKDFIVKPNFNTYGCEVSTNDIPKLHRQQLTKLGFGKMIKVRGRKKGLTSSGIPNLCHGNVAKIVKVYGGKHLWGVSVRRMEYGEAVVHPTMKGNVGCTHVYQHSIWVTPEGKLVDVTMTPYNKNKHNFTYDDENLFIPIAELGLEQIMVIPNIDMVDGLGTIALTSEGELIHTLEPNAYSKNRYIHSDNKKPFKIVLVLNQAQRSDYGGGFTLPSMFTGKSFDETMLAA